MPKSPFGRDQPQSGQQCQNPDETSSNPDAKSQNPDNYTHSKPLEDPFEDSVQNTLKSSGEAGSFDVFDEFSAESFDKPIFLERPKDLPYAFVGLEDLRRARVNSVYEGTIIMQPEDQSLPEFIESLRESYDDVITLDDLGHEDLGDVKSAVVSDYDWKYVTDQCEHHEVLFDPGDSEGARKPLWLRVIVNEFIGAQDAEMIRHAVEKHDPDFTLRVLASSFLEFYSQRTTHLERAGLTGEDLKIRGFYAGLEVLVAGIQNAQDMVPSGTLKSGLGCKDVEGVCETVLTSIGKAERGRIEALKDLALDRHFEHRKAFIWGKSSDAWDPSLPSVSKAKFFMKAVAQIKAAGVPQRVPVVDRERNIVAVCVIHFKGIYVSKGDDERVAKFFKRRPWISAGKLTEGFRAYLGVFVKGLSQGNDFKKPRFYCTNMASVSWFLAHLDRIVKELTGDYGDRYKRLICPD